jgi:hypothetical protein
MPAADFDLKALYDALDAERQTRGLTWAQATGEINSVGSAVRRHPIASSTITGLRIKTIAEGDGVLQMLRWLGRAPESFMQGLPPDLAAASLPPAGVRQVLRFDTKKLFDTLDAQRRARHLTWPQMAVETGVSASHMRHLRNGGRTGFPIVMRLTVWLEQPASQFIRLSAF